MKTVQVLGPGCKRCAATAEMVQAEADRLGVPVSIEKVTDYAAITGYGIAPRRPAPWWMARWCTPAACQSRRRSRCGWRAERPSGNKRYVWTITRTCRGPYVMHRF